MPQIEVRMEEYTAQLRLHPIPSTCAASQCFAFNAW